MLSLLERLVGTPKDHKEEKEKAKVVTTPEFDVTQYAKKLALGIPVVVAGTVAALEEFTNVEQTEGIVIGVIGLAAAALIGASLVMAVDVAARAYLAGSGSASKKGEVAGEVGDGETPRVELIPAPRGTTVWVEGSDEPHPALAIATDGEEVVSYLVASGPTVERARGTKAIDGAPKWYPAKKIRATKPAKWP